MSTSDITLANESPKAGTLEKTLSDEDLAALRRAVRAFEHPGLAARLSALAGRWIDHLPIGGMLPATLTDVVNRSAEAAIKGAMRVALATLPEIRTGEAVEPGTDVIRSPDGVTVRAGERRHLLMTAVSGAATGAFGLAALPIDLPVSTTLMLRSIAEIARSEGEDIASPEGALACVQVFALGGRDPSNGPGGPSTTDSGYFAVRAALAASMAKAAKQIGSRSLTDSSAPALVRLTSEIAARFGLMISQKFAAQAVPILGAFGGAAINAAFMAHFQSMAHAHFVIRRLERSYGTAAVRAAYATEKAALGPK